MSVSVERWQLSGNGTRVCPVGDVMVSGARAEVFCAKG